MLLTRKQNKFFDLARMMSLHSTYRFQIGAVIVRKNEIIGTGFNKPTKTHPESKHPFRTIHAELDAIVGSDRSRLKGADIYVYREHKDGTYACARPCEHCMALLKEYGVRNIYYTELGGFEYERI